MKVFFSRIAALILLAGISTSQAAQPQSEQTVRELSYGVALFHLFQQQNLSAITEITTAQQRGRLNNQSDDAELLLGSLYYDFGLPDESEKIFEQMLSGVESSAIKNRVWFNLARVQYEKGNSYKAEDLLSRIDEGLPPQWQGQKNYMLTNIYSRQQQFSAASQALQKIDEDSVWSGYARFNLGVALLDKQPDNKWLKTLARQQSEDDELRALQDNARYTLGLNALREDYLEEALGYFNQIHIDAPLSNKALLATGWAWYKNDDLQQARKYWQILRDNNVPDGATREALVALADSWEKAADKPRAIAAYQQAAAEYDRFLQELDTVAAKIAEPSFIEPLLGNSISEPQSENQKSQSDLSAADVTVYLYGLISSHDFQMALENYRQLLEIQKTLNQWQQNVPVYELMLTEREQTFHARQAQLDVDANEQRLQQLQSTRDRLAKEVQHIQAAQDFRRLANEDEVDYRDQLEEIIQLIDKLQATRDMTEAREKYRLMSGLLDYQLETEFPARFWALSHQLQLLDRALLQARQAARSLIQSARQNELRLTDFDQRIDGQQNRITEQLQRVEQLLSRQRSYIDKLAIAEIERRKQHTRALRLSARYATARLLDELAQQSSAQQVQPQ